MKRGRCFPLGQALSSLLKVSGTGDQMPELLQVRNNYEGGDTVKNRDAWRKSFLKGMQLSLLLQSLEKEGSSTDLLVWDNTVKMLIKPASPWAALGP